MNNLPNHPFSGSIATCVLLVISAGLNLLHFVGYLNEIFHLIANCATIGAACTTIYVGFLTIAKLKKEK